MPERPTVFGRHRILRAALLACALLALLPLAAGCSSPPAAPPEQAATAATSSSTVLPAVTAPAAAATSITSTTSVTPTVPVTPIGAIQPVTTTATITSTATPAGTPTPRPLPTGTPPVPLDVLNVFDVVPAGNTAAKRDILPLDGQTGDQPDNVLVTLTSNKYDITVPVTQETTSGLVVLTYDPKYREWDPTWGSEPISGTARPLPASNQYGGTNGGDLLRDGSHVLELRTTTLDGAAHLELFRYDSSTHRATLLKMVPQAGAAEKDAIFDADLDVTMADLDDDGVYEVVADNVSGVKTWRWDGSKYVPREVR